MRSKACGLLAAVSVSLAVASPALAQTKTSPATPAARPERFDVAAVTADLSGTENLPRALASARRAGPAAKAVAPRIEELVQKGLPPDLAVLAIDALGAIGAASSSAAIAPYAQHRDGAVRRAAAQALARTKGPAAKSALLRGLRSTDAAVRALSAVGLRSAGDKDSVPDLVKAEARGVTEASASIGALCVGAQCDELVGRAGKLAPAALKATLEAMLGRKPALPDDVLLAAVSRASAALGPTEKAYFVGLKGAFKGSKKVQKALDAAGRAPAEKGK